MTVKGEISCRLLEIWFQAAQRRSIDVAALIDGVGHPLEFLQGRNNRLEWPAFKRFMDNVGRFWTREEQVEMGRSVFRNPGFHYVGQIARVLFTARQFYEYTFKQGGPGTQLTPCIGSSFEVLGPNVLRLTLSLPQGYEPSIEYFTISSGAFMEMPRMLALPPAEVEMDCDGTRARYVVRLPPGGGVLPRILRTLIAPFKTREVAMELRDAHESLQERYVQLEAANHLIEQKKHELEVISVITAAAHANLDLNSALRAICAQVCGQLGYDFARFTLNTSQDGVEVTQLAEHGVHNPSHVRVAAPLTFRDTFLGELTAARAKPITEDETRFFKDVASACALAIHNAIAFEVIREYRRDLEDRVSERTAQLASALEQVKLQQVARQRIFQNISHELRTPLSLISLSTGDITYRDGERISEKSKERLGQIDDSIQRLLHLFDGMLLLAAGQEGKLRIRPRQTDIAIALRALVSAWQLAADKHGIDLHYAGPERLPVCVDEAGVERVVSNLLSNAVKFTPQAGSIEVRLEEPDSRSFRIAVQDTGVGMDPEFLGRVFGRFEQGPAPVRTGERGSGIGLAIVKEIAEAHSGSARVESQRGQGSTFLITLPREQDLAAIAAKGDGSFIPAAQEPPAERSQVDLRPTADVKPQAKAAVSTVLVAEDDPALRQFLVELLSREYRVVAAGDGLAALRLAKEHHPAILVSDVGMPGFDGFELTRRFRQLNGDKLAPVILLTAYALPESRLQGLEAGAVDYVTKPFHPEELMARVKAQLQLRELALRLTESQRLAGLGILSAGLAHELRNPANGVVNAIGPLKKLLPKEVLEPGSSTAMLLDAMTAGADQIAVLTKQLLGFSRQGELEVREEPMNRIVEIAEALVEPALGGRRIRRDLKYTGKVRCARGLVVQVLVNLLENAAHASPPGSEIVISTHVENGFVAFDVKDAGPGVPKEMHGRIFDPFFTTKAPGQGTGLGLTISKMIAERHGGNLRLLEGETGGAFRLELPEQRVELPKSSPVLGQVAVGGHS